MHDPDVVAFTLVRPWPQRCRWKDHPGGPQRKIRLQHAHQPGCAARGCTGQRFPWWRPRSWSRFWRVAGARIPASLRPALEAARAAEGD